VIYDEDDVRDYVGRGWGDPGLQHPRRDNGDNERNRKRQGGSMGLMLCNHCDAYVSTANDAPRCVCCGQRCCSRCLGKEKYSRPIVKPKRKRS
jgi:hypothetical protein